jgi:N utilization substance protein B
MISRRNIRVKVLQLLYALDCANDNQLFKNPVAELEKQLDRSRQLFVTLLYFITEVARYAEISAKSRASKNITTFEDLNVNTKIAGNQWLWKILESKSFQACLEKDKTENTINRDWVRKIYEELTQSELYKQYIQLQLREVTSEKEIIQFIFTDLILPNEALESYFEELFSNWNDDIEMMGQLMMKYLDKPTSVNLQNMVTEEKWNFAKDLLVTAMEKKEYTLALIKPKLKNWDAERIAVIDMIIMQLGVCELLYFETIPTKVTINEYIDLAKDYSTPQSGHFVNGILDSIHKELTASGKIHKTEFKSKHK